MQIKTQSEWMKAQKHAVVMGPNEHFEVIQTQQETSVFFSLGTDSVLYATGTHAFSLAVNRSEIASSRVSFSTAPPKSIAMSKLSVGDSVLGGLVKVGDFFRMLGNDIAEGLHNLQVRIIDGIHHVFATIEGIVYHALLDCASAIYHAIQWVFQQIKVLVEDLVSWLGFVFSWEDIVRTHLVTKNVIKQYINKTIDEIGKAEGQISNAFDDLEAKLNAWTDVTDPGISIGSFTSSKSPDDGSSSPQSHWGINHARSNMENAQVSQDNSVVGGLETILNDLEALVINEVDDVKDMITQIRTQIIDPYLSLTPIQIVKRLTGIIGDLLLKTAKNIIIKVLDIIRALASTVVNLLDAPIDIPVLSPIYKRIAGAELSVLDLVVLILSIPVTIIYKIAAESAPFPDNETTRLLSSATSFQTIKDLANPGPKGAVAMPMAVGTGKPITVRNRAVVPATGAGAAVYRVFAIIGRFFGVVTAWLGQIVHDVKWTYKKLLAGASPPKPWQMVGAANSILSAIPSIINAFNRSGEWEVVMTDTITGLSVLRTLIGLTPVGDDSTYKKADPYVSVFFQITQIPPPIGNIITAAGTHHALDSDYVGLAASIFARFTGILNPVSLVLDEEPEIELAVIGAANICAILQGLLMLSSAGMSIANK